MICYLRDFTRISDNVAHDVIDLLTGYFDADVGPLRDMAGY